MFRSGQPIALPCRRALHWIGAGVGSAALASCGGGVVLVWGEFPASVASTPAGRNPRPTARIVARGLSRPWALVFLPDGRMLVTERTGALRIVTADGRIGAPISGVPAADARGQGGLLDVALDPAFASNRRVYLSYAEAGTAAQAGRKGTAVARGVLWADGLQLNEVQMIFRQTPKIDSTAHFGSRLAFAPGMEQPITSWVPTSIAPCGMVFYTASLFPQRRASLFLGALAGQALWRLQLDGNRVVAREALFADLGERIRDVRQGPDGALYLISDGTSAKIYRVQPA